MHRKIFGPLSMKTHFPHLFLLPSGLALGGVLLCGCTGPAQPAADSAPAHSSSLEAAPPWPAASAEGASLEGSAQARLGGDPLSVEGAVRLAMVQNRGLRALFDGLGVTQADLAAAGRLPNPVLFGSVRWPDGPPRGPDAEFSITGDLFAAFLIPLRKSMAARHVQAEEARFEQAALDLACEVRVAAYSLQASEELLSALRESAEAEEAAAELGRRQYEAGNTPKLEMSLRESAAAEARLAVIRAEGRLAADRQAFLRLIGAGDEAGSVSVEPLRYQLPADEARPADLVALALRQRPDLAAARLRVDEVAQAYRLAAKTRLLPTPVRLGVDTERNPDGSRVTGPQLTLELPIFDQGQAELARLAAEGRRLEDEKERLAIDIAAEVRTARDAVASARAAVGVYEAAVVPARQAALAETQLAYNAMLRGPYELLAAAAAARAAEVGRIESVRDYWIATARLERALASGAPPPGVPAAHPQS